MQTVRFHQERCEEADDLLRPYSSCSYAWDEPCRPHRLVMTVPGASRLGTFSLDTVWEYPRLHLSATTQRPERTLRVGCGSGCLPDVFTSAEQKNDPKKVHKGPFELLIKLTLDL